MGMQACEAGGFF